MSSGYRTLACRFLFPTLLWCALFALGGCGTTRYTVDDGRKVDERLLANLRLLGSGERALRPAIVRSASLNDPDCSRQWELPISVATSNDWSEDDKVAWVRALQVDERLTVVAAAPACGLEVGDRIVEIDGYKQQDANKMLMELADKRDGGKPFAVRTGAGRTATLKPLEVCRGYARLAAPNAPQTQDFHWRMSIHPLNLFVPPITSDEALWMVLWTQGLSEEGGARMKAFHYSREVVSTLFEVATLATGLNAAGQAAKIAASQAAQAAAQAAAKSAAEAAAKQVLEQTARSLSEQASREYAQHVAAEMGKAAGRQMGGVLRESFMARMGFSVSSLSLVASTAFDEADAWAFDRMARLGADPLAGATLHQKLMDRGLVQNAFVLDEARLSGYATLAREAQREAMLAAVLQGESLEVFALRLGDMHAASADSETTDMPSELALSAPAGAMAGGYIDALLAMPLESGEAQ